MSNHLVSLSLHKFTRLLLDYTILTFCHFLPWFSTMYLLELPLHDSMSAEVTGATGGEAATMGHVGHNPSIEILCVQESSPISNYIISYHIYRYIHVG